jgi:hypothetical protein
MFQPQGDGMPITKYMLWWLSGDDLVERPSLDLPELDVKTFFDPGAKTAA